MSDTIFDKIVSGEIPSYKIWEDADYLAFLTPFPNTSGATVVIPKYNAGPYLFSAKDSEYTGLLLAAKRVAALLEKALGVVRVAMVVEGTGVAYAHVKLYPLHGELAAKTDVALSQTEFVDEYRGYITTLEGPPMDEVELKQIQAKILASDTN